jgi:hypothetical protein
MSESRETTTPEIPIDPEAMTREMWAQRRSKNVAILSVLIGLGVLFFVITIVRMS